MRGGVSRRLLRTEPEGPRERGPAPRQGEGDPPRPDVRGRLPFTLPQEVAPGRGLPGAMQNIAVGIVGVGNCASSLVQGLEFYRQADAATAATAPGLMH